MAVVMRTPGVYIIEKDAFPNSIVEVATAVPAFVGYTEKADNKGKSLKGKPRRISSMAEFHTYFGFAPEPSFQIDDVAVVNNVPNLESADFIQGSKPNIKGYTLTQKSGRFLLYHGMKQFFQNGGGPCFVVSVGDYSDTIGTKALKDGIAELVNESEPTMVVIPDAVLLKSSDANNPDSDCIDVQQEMLKHCGEMHSRVAILDIWGGERAKDECIPPFRDKLGVNYLDFGAAYYPWLHTTVVQETDLAYSHISNPAKLVTLLKADVVDAAKATVDEAGWTADQWAAVARDPKHDPKAAAPAAGQAGGTPPATPPAAPAPLTEEQQAWIKTKQRMLNQTLIAISPLFKTIIGELRKKLNLLPPSAAMAGIYTMVDNTRGVWKAPANVSLNGVVAPAVNLSKQDQEDLNVTPQGKSINAIRAFIGEGVLVWGARTLDGNSLDWRYISVRRTMIMLEESCRLAAKAMVFEPNVSGTWVTTKAMIQNFLTGIWKRGGLAGAVPEDAFSVHVGLGETMTSEDILEGILRVTVLVAVSRPAEFIEITFQQQMQKS